MNTSLPAWLDSALFGIGVIGPVFAFTQLSQASKQQVQCDSSLGAFQVNFPSGMQLGDVIEFVDVGNAVATNNVTLSSVVAGFTLQSPLGAIGATSYTWGAAEASGSSLKFELVQNAAGLKYLKCLSLSTAAVAGGGATIAPLLTATGQIPSTSKWVSQSVNSKVNNAIFTVLMPQTPTVGMEVEVADTGNFCATKNITLTDPNGKKIEDPTSGAITSASLVLSVNGITVTMRYVNDPSNGFIWQQI